jgi:hypothetical protein
MAIQGKGAGTFLSLPSRFLEAIDKLFASASLALLIAAGTEHPAQELRRFEQNIREFTRSLRKNSLAVRGGRARARSAQRDRLGRFLPGAFVQRTPSV